MNFKTWPLLCAGFGTLLLLTIVSAAALKDSMEKVYSEVAAIQQIDQEFRDVLDKLRTERFLVAIFIRDYLLEATADSADTRQALEAFRASIQNNLAAVEASAKTHRLEVPPSLRKSTEEYWRSIDEVFQWTPAQKASQGPVFLRKSLLPYRKTFLDAVAQMGQLSASENRQRQQQVLRTEQELKHDLAWVLGIALALGGVVVGASILRTRSLEAAAAVHLSEIENKTEELRRLSQRLADAQEDERRSISRELHDQVGQMLTALRMELGNVKGFRTSEGPFQEHMEEAEKLAEDTLKCVRNMSMGLRPSLLDELGLGPALKWQAREFARRSAVPVELQVTGDLENLLDRHRTCVYRTVQEALTNCARHAHASKISVAVHGTCKEISVSVEDDGIGFDPQEGRRRGLGLLGIEERVRDLGGRAQIISGPSNGTRLACRIPLKPE